MDSEIVNALVAELCHVSKWARGRQKLADHEEEQGGEEFADIASRCETVLEMALSPERKTVDALMNDAIVKALVVILSNRAYLAANDAAQMRLQQFVRGGQIGVALEILRAEKKEEGRG